MEKEANFEYLGTFEIRELIEENLQGYPYFSIKMFDEDDSTVLIPYCVEYKRGKRNVINLAKIRLNADESVVVEHDKTRKLYKLLKNVKTFNIRTKKEREQDALNEFIKADLERLDIEY